MLAIQGYRIFLPPQVLGVPTMIQILWSPKDDKCSQCLAENSQIRMFTCDSSITYFCKDCWFLFVLECELNVDPWENQTDDANWENEIQHDWDIDVDIVLMCEDAEHMESTKKSMEFIRNKSKQTNNLST